MDAVAAKALDRWDVGAENCVLAARRENTVYRVTGGSGGAYALRLHRPDYHSDAELLSELQWMAALGHGGLTVPLPVASRRGAHIETVEGVRATLLTWLPGRPLGASRPPLDVEGRAGVFFRLGETMAALHSLSDAWPLPEGFTRRSWDAAGLLGDAPLWGPFWDNPLLDSAERAQLLAARARARTELASLRSADFGLIHADLVRENVILDGARIGLIDFDDCGFGYRLFDVATVLLKNLGRPDYAALEASLLQGYSARRALDPARLPLFMILRSFTYLGWVIPRLGEPGNHERNKRFAATALPLARRYLSGPEDRALED